MVCLLVSGLKERHPKTVPQNRDLMPQHSQGSEFESFSHFLHFRITGLRCHITIQPSVLAALLGKSLALRSHRPSSSKLRRRSCLHWPVVTSTMFHLSVKPGIRWPKPPLNTCLWIQAENQKPCVMKNCTDIPCKCPTLTSRCLLAPKK
jgi:hypothetical protein